MTEQAKSLPQLIDEASAHEFERTAQHLEELRNRLGKDGLSMDEWNALVGAASHLRIDAWRRSQGSVVLPIQPEEGILANDIAWLRERAFMTEKGGDEEQFERIAATLETLQRPAVAQPSSPPKMTKTTRDDDAVWLRAKAGSFLPAQHFERINRIASRLSPTPETDQVIHAAQRFCAELCEDADGVPQPELRALHAALDAWENGNE